MRGVDVGLDRDLVRAKLKLSLRSNSINIGENEKI